MKKAAAKHIAILRLLSVAAVAAVAIGGRFLVTSVDEPGQQARVKYSRCEHNLESIAHALEVYKQTQEHYPDRLGFVFPDEAPSQQALLHCPASGREYGLYLAGNGNEYELVCEGHAHADVGIPASYPRYTSKSGPNFPSPSP